MLETAGMPCRHYETQSLPATDTLNQRSSYYTLAAIGHSGIAHARDQLGRCYFVRRDVRGQLRRQRPHRPGGRGTDRARRPGKHVLDDRRELGRRRHRAARHGFAFAAAERFRARCRMRHRPPQRSFSVTVVVA